METGKNITTEKTEDFELNFFEISDESAFNPGEDFKEDAPDEDEKNPKKVNQPSDEEDEEDEDNKSTDTSDEDDETDEDDDKTKSLEKTEDTEPDFSDIDKTMSSLIDEGLLLLPEDYEYEDSKEGLFKAFEDSEKYRNEIAFQEAIKYLTSKDGLDLIKVQESVKKIDSYENLDVEKLSEDDKLNIVKEFYSKKEYDEADIDSIIEDLIGNEIKLERELSIATKYLKKEEEKRIQEEAITVEKRNKAQKEYVENSQKILKQKLQSSSDFNGYIIKESNKDKIFNALYKPIRLEDGNITTDFNSRLSSVLNDPDKILVLADLLMNMNDKGFDFSTMSQKRESEAVAKVKKSIRDFKNTNTKSKISGKNSQTQNDFDLSRASMEFKY